MITIKDVAKKAGVSIATVSRVINNAENVGADIRKTVLDTIDTLGYNPNSFARSLKKKSFKTIGVIMSDLSVPFFGKIIKHIENSFREEGYIVLFVNTYDDPEIEKKGIQVMLEKQADVLLISSTGQNEEYLFQLQNNGMKVILFDRRSKSYQFPTVFVDKRLGTYQLLDSLMGLGHKKIAMLSGERSLSTNYDRFAGVTDFIYEHDLPIDTVDCRFKSFSEEFGYSSCADFMRMCPHPTAIITGSSIIATGVMLFCKENNIRIPEDISLVSFGDFYSGTLIEPRLSYVEDGHVEIGNILVEMIESALVCELDRSQNIAIKPTICLNASVGPVNSKSY